MNELKRKILNNCFVKSGKFLLAEKFINSELLFEIKKVTTFLPDITDYKIRVKYILNDWDSKRKCPICGEDIDDHWDNSYRDLLITCSHKCAGRLAYTIGMNKRQYTCVKKYGYKTPFESRDIQYKVKNTLKKKYGVNSVSKLHSVKQKKSEKLDDRLNKDWVKFKTDKFFAKFEWESHTPIELSDKYNVNLTTIYRQVKKYGFDVKNKHKSCSSYEVLIIKKIKSFYNGKIIQSDRKEIYPLEIDIFIPEFKLGIEVCGLYWHSEKYKDNMYHKKKLDLCNNKNIRLLTLFEDEIIESFDIIIKKIKYLMGFDIYKIFARNTVVVYPDNKERKIFLTKYHIQGNAGGFNIGLQYDDKLVAIGVFKKRGEKEYELVRYCTKYSVVGGFSKIIKSFYRCFPNIKKIVSFADLRIVDFKKNVYITNGWDFDYYLKPDYFFIKKQKRLHKFNLRHLDNKYHDYYNEGYLKIYDCGKIKYVNFN